MTELMQMIIDKLGVKVGGRFKTREYYDAVFCFNDGGEMTLVDGVKFVEAIDSILVDLLQGNDEIIKLPLKPEHAEKYYFVNKYGEIGWESWVDYEIDYYRFNAKNCFRTEKEITEEDKKRIVAEMKREYENG
jgi:hypothetical protein